jgi:hypothetical protein
MKRSRLFVALAVAAAVGLASCGSAGPRVEGGAYEGPRISLEDLGGRHILVLTAPTGGWGFGVDQVRQQFDHDEVYVTARRPNPAYMQTQALVRHEAATGVSADRSLRIYARVLRHDAALSGPYQEVGQAGAGAE